MTIWPPYEAFYIDSMLFSTKVAVASAEAIAARLELLDARTLPSETLDEDWLLNHLQTIVLHGATLSRFLWPVRASHAARGEHLRKAFGTTDTSPLKNRELRNALEHFDERLDNYLTSGVHGTIIPRYVGYTPRARVIPAPFLRAYFIDRGAFVLLGHEYEMQSLVDEIGRVHELLIAAKEDGYRLGTSETT